MMAMPDNLPFSWPPTLEMIGRDSGDARKRGLQFCWVQHAPASHSKACKQSGGLIRWVDPADPMGYRSPPCAQCMVWKAGWFEREEDLDRLKDIMIPESVERIRKNLAASKLADDYKAVFGWDSFFSYDQEAQELMALSLTSGMDQLVDRKQKHKEMREERERKQEEFLAAPITEEQVSHYTSLIKRRKLYEGACDLSWEKYFERVRVVGVKLTPEDLEYAAQWTSCAVKP
jgi:hypothetical protein